MSEVKDFDKFWISEGQKLVSDTFENLNKHLTNYASYLKYLKGFFLVGGLTLEAFYQSTDPVVFFAFIAPMAVLYIATFQVSAGRRIKTSKLDLRSPLKINKSYNGLVDKLKEDITKAKWWVSYATGAVLLGGSIAIYALNAEIKNNKADKADAEIVKEFRKNQKLHLTLNIKEKKAVIEAKLQDKATYTLDYIDAKDSTISLSVEVPALTDYKKEIGNVEKVISFEPEK